MVIRTPSFITIEGRRIAYDEVSPPNPRGTILLITGLASKRAGWYKQLPVFGQEYRTIALDNREMGDSDLTGQPYTTLDQANDAAELLKALGVKKANVIGISMGGFISLTLTLNHPELVEKLVLVSTSAGGPSHVQPGPEMLQNLMSRDFKTEVGELARLTYTRITAPGFAASHPYEMEKIMEIARYKPLGAEAYSRQLMTALSYNASERLAEIKVPTLVIHGDVDPLVPTPNGINLGNKIKGAKLLLYPNTGHIPIIEQEERFNRDVLEFLKS